jgi:hypothetical protein
MNSMKIPFYATTFILLAFALVACEPEREVIETDEGTIEITQDNEKADITVKTDVGDSMSMTVHKGKLPEGWPADIPVIPGGEISFSQTAGSEGMQQVHLQTDRSVDEASQYYKEKLEGSGWSVGNTMSMPMMNMVTAQKGGKRVMVQVAQTEDKTFVQIAVEQ